MRRTTKLQLLATAAGLFAAAGGLGTARAQAQGEAQPQAPSGGTDVSATQLGEVVVTGTKAVIEPVQQIKQTQQPIVDSITARQIDLLPDRSVAEALDRVVGVSSDLGYQTAEPRTVTIRGFDARYNSMEVDGNPIWNASRNNRGTQLDIFPAGAISQVNVYKTVTPDQDANSIGGHVELRTLRAFDGGGQPYLAVRLEGGAYEQGPVSGDKTPSYLMSIVGKRTFGPDGLFGVVLGADVQRDRLRNVNNAVTGYSQIGGNDVVNGSMFAGVFDETVAREALYAKLEAGRPDHLYGFISASFFREQDDEDNTRSGPFLTATKVKNVSEGAGTFSNVPDEAYDEAYRVDRKTSLIGAGVDYAIARNQSVSLRASYTNYDHHEADFTGERFEGPTVSGSYDLGDNGFGAVFLPNAASQDPANWVFRNTKPSTITSYPDNDNVYSLKLDYDVNDQADADGFGFKAGVFWRRLDRGFNETQDSYVLPKGDTLTLAQVLEGTARGASPLGPNYINTAAFWSLVEAQGVRTVNTEQTADYHLLEDVLAAHATVFYRYKALRIMAGFRIEDTVSDDHTSNTQGGAIVPVENRYSYLNPLPNVQLTYDFTHALRAKLAFTKTIARPDFSDYAMGRTVSTDANGYPVISGANPFLKPREANNYDSALEYYFAGGYASVGLFHKDLFREEFSQLTQTTNALGQVILTETEPLNTGNGALNGLELNFVEDRLTWLPKPLDGLTFSANYTRLDGRWNVVFTNGTTRTVDGLRNQPRWLGNVMVGYVYGPFSVTTALRFRGDTFSGTFGTTAAGDIWYRNYMRLDLQANYRVSRRLRLFAEARNLNDAHSAEYTGAGQVLYNSITPGRSVFGGVKLNY